MGTGVASGPDRWHSVGRSLATSHGVHRPSAFSALLAESMSDCAGQVVVDAGCGAGLVAIAALAAGAEHVVAQDYDRNCLIDTAANVDAVLGEGARRRLSLWEADWRQLAAVRADVLAVNPPQRPTTLLSDVDGDVLHLHQGAGLDGLDALRMILGHARTRRVRSTAAALLGLRECHSELSGNAWHPPTVVAKADLALDPAWRRLRENLQDTVEVWEFSRQ
ncbi:MULTISPECIES: 50S ribosomal protein L11 methyltransferase [unclassified Micromonospora]|uniref:50S ribosomal protein L11 methyltransferase n=1 Tax=unclassified Micromonospora TaxID=2617518 RepID=UPI003A87F431